MAIRTASTSASTGPADDLERRLHRPDVAFYYGFLPGANRSGFRCAHRLTQAPAAHWTIENVNRDTGRAIEPWHNFYVTRQRLDGRARRFRAFHKSAGCTAGIHRTSI